MGAVNTPRTRKKIIDRILHDVPQCRLALQREETVFLRRSNTGNVDKVHSASNILHTSELVYMKL